MESEVIVEVTEFDNLRNEYLQQEAAGIECLSMLKAQMNAEYRVLLDDNKQEAESYLNEAKNLIMQLCEWKNSTQYKIDKEFLSRIDALVKNECKSQNFSLREDDVAWVYLAGENNACLHLGNETDSVRLVYTRDGITDCVLEAVSLLRTKREERKREIFNTLHSMQEALISARANMSELDTKRIKKVFYSSMVGTHADFVEDLIACAANTNCRKSRKVAFSVDSDTYYYEFVKYLIRIATPLIMAGNGKPPLFRFVLTIPQENEIRVSWDSYNCKNYLYGETFNVKNDYQTKIRSWWSQSCMLELKRLKTLETELKNR